MSKKETLIEISPDEDKRCPAGTKKYLLEMGYKPYRKENGKITWVNDSSRIYKSIRQRHKSFFFSTDRFGHKRPRRWVRALPYVMIALLILAVIALKQLGILQF